MDDENKKDSLFRKGEEFLEMFRQGQEFTQELMQDNERLRYRVVQLEEELKAKLDFSQEPVALAAYDERLRELENRLVQVEEENLNFAQRYIDVEEQNNNLANLYVASYQLHSTLDYDEVLQIILEIIINLIGAEVFAIFLLDEKEKALLPAAAEGVGLEAIEPIPLGQGTIGQAAELNQSYFNENPPKSIDDLFQDPLVCIPLLIKEELIGVICLYRLLQQKEEFVAVDFELFTLLAGHAATAIFSARLYTESRRKLTTYQGFLDLLSQ
ncbi:MAG: GAF domain-containing protein [bacterium]|nr:MAG: GAF domain-containing protein [bacterium]